MHDEMDILREVGSIASGHGSIALSEMLDRKIKLKFPSIDIVTPLEVPARLNVDEVAVIMYSKILVGLEGEVAIVLSRDNTAKLINLSYHVRKDEKNDPGFITEFSLSVIKEVGSVIIASYLNALSLMLKRMIVPPMPTLISGSFDDVLRTILTSHRDVEYCYLIETVFEEDSTGLKGGFFLVLTPYAACDIKKACHQMLGDNNEDVDLDVEE